MSLRDARAQRRLVLPKLFLHLLENIVGPLQLLCDFLLVGQRGPALPLLPVNLLLHFLDLFFKSAALLLHLPDRDPVTQVINGRCDVRILLV